MIKRILLLMLFSASSYALTFNQAQAVYDNLLRANEFTIAPRLVLDPTSSVNASCSVFRITINAGMLRFVHNSSELAMVLGHELGHYTNHDRGSTPEREYRADALGAVYAQRAHYNRCLGADVYRRFHHKASKTHPDSDSRYNRLKC